MGGKDANLGGEREGRDLTCQTMLPYYFWYHFKRGGGGGGVEKRKLSKNKGMGSHSTFPLLGHKEERLRGLKYALKKKDTSICYSTRIRIFRGEHQGQGVDD